MACLASPRARLMAAQYTLRTYSTSYMAASWHAQLQGIDSGGKMTDSGGYSGNDTRTRALRCELARALARALAILRGATLTHA